MTKEDKKLIQGLVKPLPEMKSKTLVESVTISGETLIEMGQTKTRQGSAIEPKKRYLIERAKVVNHKTNAEKIFDREGIKGVEKYCADILEKNRLYYESKEIGASNIN